MTAPLAVLAPSLYPSILDPSTGTPLVAGTFSFFGQDQVTPKNVYPSPDTTGSPYPNPYTLDSVAAEPPFYFLTDEPYWIEIRPAPAPGCDCMEADPIYSFFYYPNTVTPSSETQQVFNFITNGQFQNPIVFNTPDQETGQIYNSTMVAPAWFVDLQNPTDVIQVTFESTLESGLAANPSNLIQFRIVSGVGPDLRQKIGQVNMLQNQLVTLFLEGSTLSGALATITVIVQQYYGSTGTTNQTTVGTLTLPAQGSTGPFPLSLQFQIPELPAGQAVDLIANQTSIILRGPAFDLTSYELTNIQIELGTVATPSYIEQPHDITTSRSIANTAQIPTNLFDQVNGWCQYMKQTYIGSSYTWTANTGTFKPVVASAIPPDMLAVTGQTLNPQGYVNNIPLARLYSVIGNTFGGSGNIIATADAGVVTAGSSGGARENSTWTAGTSGFTVTHTQIGLPLGISAALTAGQTTSVDCTFINNFAPLQTAGIPAGYTVTANVIGSWYSVGNPFTGPGGQGSITSTTIAAGSPSTQAIGRLVFDPNPVLTYPWMTGQQTNSGIRWGFQFLEFASSTNNFRGNYVSTTPPAVAPSPMAVLFQQDGVYQNSFPVTASQATVTVNFLSTNSLAQNVQGFINAVNVPFQYTIAVAALPAASSYFLFSSSSTDYYVWFKINGAGADPAIGGRSPLECDLLSTDTTITAAQKIAAVMQTSSFAVPTQADLAALSSPDIVWAIYL